MHDTIGSLSLFLGVSFCMCVCIYIWASLVVQMIKNLPAMQETWIRGWEDPLEKGMATHSTVLAWTVPWTEEPGELQSTTERLILSLAHTHTHTHTHTGCTAYCWNVYVCMYFIYKGIIYMSPFHLKVLPLWFDTQIRQVYFFSYIVGKKQHVTEKKILLLPLKTKTKQEVIWNYRNN